VDHGERGRARALVQGYRGHRSAPPPAAVWPSIRGRRDDDDAADPATGCYSAPPGCDGRSIGWRRGLGAMRGAVARACRRDESDFAADPGDRTRAAVVFLARPACSRSTNSRSRRAVSRESKSNIAHPALEPCGPRRHDVRRCSRRRNCEARWARCGPQLSHLFDRWQYAAGAGGHCGTQDLYGEGVQSRRPPRLCLASLRPLGGLGYAPRDEAAVGRGSRARHDAGQPRSAAVGCRLAPQGGPGARAPRKICESGERRARHGPPARPRCRRCRHRWCSRKPAPLIGHTGPSPRGRPMSRQPRQTATRC